MKYEETDQKISLDLSDYLNWNTVSEEMVCIAIENLFYVINILHDANAINQLRFLRDFV